MGKPIESLRIEPKEVREYRKQLSNAGVPEEDVEKSVEAFATRIDAQPITLRVSRQVVEVVQQAEHFGLDPSPYLSEAATVAQQDGRKKVGLFGRARTVFSRLEALIQNRETQALYGLGQTETPEVTEVVLQQAIPVRIASGQPQLRR